MQEIIPKYKPLVNCIILCILITYTFKPNTEYSYPTFTFTIFTHIFLILKYYDNNPNPHHEL